LILKYINTHLGYFPKKSNKLSEIGAFRALHFDAAGIKPGNPLSGVSMLPLMQGKKKGYKVEAVFAGRECHSYSRYNNMGHPVWAVRWGDYLLIHNFKYNLWPAGDPKAINGQDTLENAYYDIDDCPSKTFLTENGDRADIKFYFDAAVAKRPEFELFDLSKDRSCMKNVAGDKKCAKIFARMKKMLQDKLVETNDSRIGPNPDI
jgi:uncharacterized sulfatase